MAMKYWSPDAPTAQSETNVLCRWASSAAAEGLFAVSSDAAHRVVDRLSEGTHKLGHPSFFQWYFTLKDRLAAGEAVDGSPGRDLELVFDEIERSHERREEHRRRLGLPIDLASNPRGVLPSIVKAIAMAKVAAGGNPTIQVMTAPDRELEDILRSGAGILAEHWPEMLAEIATTVRQLFIFSSEKVIGFVDFRSHGAVWLRESAIRTPLQFAEELIHEASHVRLNAAHAVSPLFLNDDRERYASPLRADPRPMFGVFHQMFVLCRLVEFYRRIFRVRGSLANTALRRGTIDDQRQKIRDNLAASHDIVVKHAQLTPAGEALLRNIAESALLA